MTCETDVTGQRIGLNHHDPDMTVIQSAVERKDATRLDLLASDTLFWRPKHLDPSSWLAHAPLVFWLLEATQPRNMVVVGAENSSTYQAIGQAVEQFSTETACTALPYTNAHFEPSPVEVDFLYTDLRSIHTDLSDFWGDWRGHLSERAILLVHGLNTRSDRDEVDAFLTQLHYDHPIRIFEHGDGLALVLVGTGHPEVIERFAGHTGDISRRRSEDRLICHLGAGLLHEALVRKHAETHRTQEARIEALTQEKAEMRAILDARERKHVKEMRIRFKEIAKLITMLETARRRGSAAGFGHGYPSVTFQNTFGSLFDYAVDLERRHAIILTSNSWRTLEPGRKFVRLLKGRRPPPPFSPCLQGTDAARIWERLPPREQRAYLRELERRHIGVLESNSWHALAPIRRLARRIRGRNAPPPFVALVPDTPITGRSVPRD